MIGKRTLKVVFFIKAQKTQNILEIEINYLKKMEMDGGGFKGLLWVNIQEKIKMEINLINQHRCHENYRGCNNYAELNL